VDPVTIGLILAGAAVVVGLLAWLLPRQQKIVIAPEDVPASPSKPSPETALKVTLSYGFLTLENPRGLSDQMALVKAASRYHRPVRVTSVGLRLEGGRQMPWFVPGSQRPLPFVLNETEANQFWAPMRDIGAALIEAGFSKPLKVRAYVADSYDVEHLSDWKEVNPVEFSKAGS
jgi:hypothetical protein